MDENTGHLMRFLQQENRNLQDENETLKQESQALRLYVEGLDHLYQAAQRISCEENLLDLLDEILYNAMRLANAADGSLMLLDDETDELVFVVVHGDISGKLRGHRIGANTGVAGWVAAEGQSAIVNHPRQDRRFSPTVDEAFGFVTQSLISVPMITADKTIGVINMLNKQDGEEFSEADASLLSMLGQVAASALESMRIRLEAEEEAAAAD